jgi:hypothetical protein
MEWQLCCQSQTRRWACIFINIRLVRAMAQWRRGELCAEACGIPRTANLKAGVPALGSEEFFYNAKVTRTATTAKKVTKPALKILTAGNLESQDWLLHGFSTRKGGVSLAYGKGSLNLGITKHDSRENVERNRELFLRGLGAVNGRGKPWPIVGVRQIHSAVIHRVTGGPETVLVGDGFVTNTPGLLLTVKTADCVPVLLADPERRAVGAFHAGWKGTLARIVEKGVGELRKHFGSQP